MDNNTITTSGNSEDFNVSEKIGAIGERFVVNFLRKAGYKFLFKTPGKNSDFDVKMLKIRKSEYESFKTIDNIDLSNIHYVNTSINTTIEIKTDCYDIANIDMGNIAIEFNQYTYGGSFRKPSGIYVTIANIWINYFPNLNEIWIINVPDLKLAIEELKKSREIHPKYRVASEGNPTDCFLIDRKIAFKYFTVLNAKTGAIIESSDDINYRGNK